MARAQHRDTPRFSQRITGIRGSRRDRFQFAEIRGISDKKVPLEESCERGRLMRLPARAVSQTQYFIRAGARITRGNSNYTPPDCLSNEFSASRLNINWNSFGGIAADFCCWQFSHLFIEIKVPAGRGFRQEDLKIEFRWLG